VDVDRNDVARIAPYYGQAILPNERLARWCYPDLNVGGQLAHIRSPQSGAKSSASDVGHQVNLEIGLLVTGSYVERTVAAVAQTCGKAHQAGYRGADAAASGATIPVVDQGERGSYLSVAPERHARLPHSKGERCG
jgi:hypothetical protein